MRRRTTTARRRETEEPPYRGAPDVSRILKRMRQANDLSIREVAEGSGLSASFVSALERGESDVSIGRLARIAEFFHQDLGALLGYSTRVSRPNFAAKSDRKLRNRGRGVRYELIRVPGLNVELAVMSFEPRSGFRDEMIHEGVDVLYVTSGEMVLRVNEVDYPMQAGDCASYLGSYSHTMRNDSAKPASALGITTAHM
jgi:transcriptional regulator with XRE-family HTH domain